MNSQCECGSVTHAGGVEPPSNVVSSCGKQKFISDGENGDCDGETAVVGKRARLSADCSALEAESACKEVATEPPALAEHEKQVGSEVKEGAVMDGKEERETWQSGSASTSECTDTDTEGSLEASPVSGSSYSSVSLPSPMDNAEFALDFAENAAENGVSPRDILRELLPPDYFESLPKEWSDGMLWRLIDAMTTPRRRSLRSDVHTLEHAVACLRSAQRILVVTGAGISVNSGIPDFRSPRGVYAMVRKRFPDFAGSPESLFDIGAFRRDPRPFFTFAQEILPGNFKPTKAHAFLKLLETRGSLLRNYTQNIDTIEAGVQLQRVLHCHGSFATATCLTCGARYPLEAYRPEVERGEVPHCTLCLSGAPSTATSSCDDVPASSESRAEPSEAQLPNAFDNESDSPGTASTTEKDEKKRVELALQETRGVVKPDIVFFGESLPTDFYDNFESDRAACDLLIVIGSSMKVRPVALIPNAVGRVPQILINNEPLHNSSCAFDVELIGDCDVICTLLTQKLLESDCSQPTNESQTANTNEFVAELVASAGKLQLDPIQVDFTQKASSVEATAVAEKDAASASVPGTSESESTVLMMQKQTETSQGLFANQEQVDAQAAQVDAFLQTVSFDKNYVHVLSDERRYFFKGCSTDALKRSCCKRKSPLNTVFVLTNSPNCSSNSTSDESE